MKLVNDSAKTKFRCVIEEDKSVGFYLYIYEKKTVECIRDHLQDTLEMAKEQAEQEYGAKHNEWIVHIDGCSVES